MGGKKGKKFRNKKKRNEERKQNNRKPHDENFTLTTVEQGNFKFEAYYALQGLHDNYFNDKGELVPCTTDEQKEQERLRWRNQIGLILPASFRTAYDISESLKERLEKELEELVDAQAKAAAAAAAAEAAETDKTKQEEKETGDDNKKKTDDHQEAGEKSDLITTTTPTKKAIQKIPFLPHAYQFLEINRKTIRKDPTMKDLFDWMKKQTEAGFITRQETVSMIPPVVLAPQPDDCVLDMCAAPGSKTCQILEKLSPNGSMVANDSSYQRAYMLVNQLRRILHNNPVVLVTSAEAQFFPQSITYDKILADVPCSGDGTTRKNIGIWKQWNQLGALALHSLQLDIAWKGVAMLKVGGYMCYSTCSYNPIENEAVVAELLRRANGSLELVDAPLEGFKVRPGLRRWHVLVEAKSKRQMMNEKKKNNAKMKERRAQWEEKQQRQQQKENDSTKEEAGGDEATAEAAKKGESDTKSESNAEGAANPDEGNSGETSKAGAAAVDAEGAVASTDGDGKTPNAEEEGKQSTPRKFEPPSSWDEENLIGLAKEAGLMHFEKVEDVPNHLTKRVKASCFPPTEEELKSLPLEKCIRCLSHDNDTGGFFIALFKKTSPISRNEANRIRRSAEVTEATDDAEPTEPDVKRMKLNEPTTDSGPTAVDEDSSKSMKEDEVIKPDGNADNNEAADEEMESTETSTKPKREVKSNRLEDGKGGKHKDVGRDDFVPADKKLFPPLIEFFGFSDSFPQDQIMTRAIGDGKVLYYLAKSVKENFIDRGIQQRVTIIGSGLKAFVRNTNWGSECEYRLSQEAIHFMLPHMSKRKLVVGVDDFTKCLTGDGSSHNQIKISEFSEEFSKVVTEMAGGPFVALLKGYETDYARKLFLVMWRCRGATVNCMVSKAEIEGMKSKIGALKEEEETK